MMREKVKRAALITLLICGVVFFIGGAMAIVGLSLHSVNPWWLLALPPWIFLCMLAGDYWTEM